MKKTGESVAAFIAGVTPAKRQRDAATMVSLMREITGREPEMWGTIVGFGACHYRYPTGTEGDMPVAAFAPRKQATTVYLMDTGAHGDELAKLGPHDTGVGCLYIKDLEAVDADVLRDMIAADYRRVLDGDTGSVEITLLD
ncbi:DUF1801 domain-containing protein [Microbacterium gallinarum]|jgi:hypothetical protein|uniref:DUF1801 domain-containing protein n=1 Tax=Microbacterium gallinarum TaxID=2762209 RepID=A0ABR8X0W4_9MICO|nr:DUF1801 domain-containing protein [Microbacterium gallinarum]MBD8022822.1 DUF1801 domain-containing protein [Microbacterium gallinarum]